MWEWHVKDNVKEPNRLDFLRNLRLDSEEETVTQVKEQIKMKEDGNGRHSTNFDNITSTETRN
jgi:hypothetical protein